MKTPLQRISTSSRTLACFVLLLTLFLLPPTVVASAATPTPASASSPPAATPVPAPASVLPSAPKPDDIVGDWEGTLDAGAAKLRIAIHITKNPDGSFKATLDSLDQGATGIGVDKTTFEGSALHLELGAMKARYDGTLNKDATQVVGTWAQASASLPLTLTRGAADAQATDKQGAADKPTASDPIKPHWMGTLDAGGAKLRLVIHLERDGAGVLSGTLDSLDQGAMGLRIERAEYRGGKLTLELKTPPARFEGTVNKEGTEATGNWIQSGASLPLVLTAIEKAPVALRPQEPKRPLPYLEEEVAYTSPPSGVKIAGTLTTPKSGGPFAAVLLITGSGPEDRDEMVFGHRPFLVLADHLTRQGIAVLRTDDRGVGGTSAGPGEATTDDLVADVLAGVAFLRARKEIDPARIGLVGHSEGGLIAPRAAMRSKDVGFIVLMAGPGLPGEEILQAQSALILKAEGAPDDQIARTRAINTKVYGILKEEKDPAEAGARIRKELEAVPGLPKETIDALAKQVVSPWFRYFLSYDPRPTLALVKVPVLAVAGERDLQVPAKENVAAIRTALENAGHQDHTLVVLPGLNHLLQECTTGSPSEYGSIEQTVSPVALRTISDWILAHESVGASAGQSAAALPQ